MEDELTAEKIAQREIAFSHEMKEIHSSGASYSGTSALNNNIDINTPSFTQAFLDECLAVAAQVGDVERFFHLIQQSANLNTALRITIAEETQNINQATTFVFEKYDIPLPISIFIPHPYPGTSFLLGNNADVNNVYDGNTLLDESVDKGEEAVARVLIQHKADINNSLKRCLENAQKGGEVKNLDIWEKLVNTFIPGKDQNRVSIIKQLSGNNIEIIQTLMTQMQKYHDIPLNPVSDNHTEEVEELTDSSLLGDS
jgi:ankyrin repeat protein